MLRQKVAEYTPRVRAVDYELELGKIQREIEKALQHAERAVRFMVEPEHAASQKLFEGELAKATERRLAAEQRKRMLEEARTAEAALAERKDSVMHLCHQVLRGLSRLTREQWRHVLQVLLDQITVTGRRLEVRGILPDNPGMLFRSQRQHVVAARRGHFERALGGGLAAHVAKVQAR